MNRWIFRANYLMDLPFPIRLLSLQKTKTQWVHFAPTALQAPPGRPDLADRTT